MFHFDSSSVWADWDPVQVTVDCLTLLPVFSCFIPNAAVTCQSQTEALLKQIPVFKTIPDHMITSSGAGTETECQVGNHMQCEYQ